MEEWGGPVANQPGPGGLLDGSVSIVGQIAWTTVASVVLAVYWSDDDVCDAGTKGYPCSPYLRCTQGVLQFVAP